MSVPSPIPVEESFDGLYGLEILSGDEQGARARVRVERRICQPFGLVHGGVYASMAEALASMATYGAVHDAGNIAVGQSNNTSFLRPITAGYVHALARPRHRGRTTWLWDVEITDDDGRLCATSRVTIAVRPRPAP